MAFAPDGRSLASAGADGTVRLWDAATGEELTALHIGTSVSAMEWSPNGAVLGVGVAATVTRLNVRREY